MLKERCEVLPPLHCTGTTQIHRGPPITSVKGEKGGLLEVLTGLPRGESASLWLSLMLVGRGWLASSRLWGPDLASAGRMKNSLLLRPALSGDAPGVMAWLAGALLASMASAAAEGWLSTKATMLVRGRAKSAQTE